LSSATSTLASRVRVESMLSARPRAREPSVNVAPTMSETLSVNAVWNLVLLTHVESMLIVPHLEAMPFANVVRTTLATRTPTATLTRAPATRVAREHFVRTMGELQCASVRPSTSAIPT